MKNLNRIIIVSTLLTMLSCGSKEIQPPDIATPTEEIFSTQIFYIKWKGDESRKKKTLNDLSEKKCWTLKEVVPESGNLSSVCHEFAEYKNKSDIHGLLKKIGSGLLIEVHVDKENNYKAQIFEKSGKKLRLVNKLAKFLDPDDFALTLKRLTFK